MTDLSDSEQGGRGFTNQKALRTSYHVNGPSLVVEGAVLGQDVLLVVALQALPQLHVRHGVAALRVRDHLRGTAWSELSLQTEGLHFS